MTNLEIGKVVKFGKVTKHFVEKPFKIHFLVFQEKGPNGEEGFGAVALEFGYFSFSENEQEAVNAIMGLVNSLALKITDTNEVLYHIEKINLDEYWEIYRKITYLYGDPETDRINNHIESLQTKNQQLSEENIEKSEEIFSLRVDLDSLQKKLHANPKLSDVPG